MSPQTNFAVKNRKAPPTGNQRGRGPYKSACDACAQRKIKCGGIQPCHPCQSQCRQCTWTKNPARKLRKEAHFEATHKQLETEKRVADLESQLAECHRRLSIDFNPAPKLRKEDLAHFEVMYKQFELEADVADLKSQLAECHRTIDFLTEFRQWATNISGTLKNSMQEMQRSKSIATLVSPCTAQAMSSPTFSYVTSDSSPIAILQSGMSTSAFSSPSDPQIPNGSPSPNPSLNPSLNPNPSPSPNPNPNLDSRLNFVYSSSLSNPGYPQSSPNYMDEPASQCSFLKYNLQPESSIQSSNNPYAGEYLNMLGSQTPSDSATLISLFSEGDPHSPHISYFPQAPLFNTMEIDMKVV